MTPTSGRQCLAHHLLDARKALFGAVYTHSPADFRRPETSVKARWAIEGNWKLIVPGVACVQHPNRKLELYDLQADPHETHNFVESKPALVKQMREALDEWWPAT